jgi:hypothetical protein
MHSNAPRRSMPSFSSFAICFSSWPHGEKTDGCGELFPVIYLNFGAGAFQAMNDHVRDQAVRLKLSL